VATGTTISKNEIAKPIASYKIQGMSEDLPPIQHDHLPRLAANAYRGRAIVHWTLTVKDRSKGWLTSNFHSRFRWLMLHGCARYDVACPIYCLMPDHAHLLIVGWTQSADQRLFMPFFRKHTEPMLAECGAAWQKQAYDHVLRPQESDRYAFETLAHYINQNPVRAGLVQEAGAWAYSGCVIPGYPELTLKMPNYWTRYWRLVAFRNGL
jgi:REP element-mobilizing transposase RayT